MNPKRNQNSYSTPTGDVYVSNVPKSMSQNEIKHIFNKYGEVKEVLCRWKEEYFGYAIVKYVYKIDSEKVLREVPEVQFEGYTLPVRPARKYEHSENSFLGKQNGGFENRMNQFPEKNTNHYPERNSNYYPERNSSFYPERNALHYPERNALPYPERNALPYPERNAPPYPERIPHHFPERNPNNFFPGLKFSNTDYGHFYHPMPYPEDYTPVKKTHPHPVMLEVLCTNVESAVTFYGCLVNRSDELAALIDALNRLNLNKQARLKRKPCVKRVYAALFSEDDSWYRCSIIQSDLPNSPNMCAVRYIDYGNQEQTAYDKLVELPETLQKIPAFANRFTFSNLVCDSKTATKKSPLHMSLNKRMSLSAYLSPNRLDYEVLKCSCNGKDIIAETVNKGYAKNKSFHTGRQENTVKPKPKQGSETKFQKNNANVAKKVNETSTNAKKQLKSSSQSENNILTQNGAQGGFEDISRKESGFNPKTIIKRGSEICLRKAKSEDVSDNNANGQSELSMIDTIIPNLKLINNVRSLVSQSSDDSIIIFASNLLKEEMSTVEATENSKDNYLNAQKNYEESLEAIKNCTDQSVLVDLKEKRDSTRNVLCEALKDYLGSYDRSVFERKDKIQQTITDLESNSTAWMNVQLAKKPESIEELITDYNKIKEERWKMVSDIRDSTNSKHKHFIEVLTSLQNEFYLNILEDDNVSEKAAPPNTSNPGKPKSYSDELCNALKDLEKAVDEEIKTLITNKESGAISVIQYLLEVLDIHKEKMDSLCELYENCYAAYNELSKLEPIDQDLHEIASAKQEVIALATQLTNSRESSQDDSQAVIVEGPLLLKLLHKAMLKEDHLKGNLAKASEYHYPELNIEHPEIDIVNYQKYNGLMKDWKIEYFSLMGSSPRGKTAFVSNLNGESIVIKEYEFESEKDLSDFVEKAVKWHNVKNDSLVEIKALFPKDEKSIYVILPPTPGKLIENTCQATPFESEKSCHILHNVLVGLEALHSQGVAHGSLHPASILLDNGRAMLDFCYEGNNIEEPVTIKGINFQPPEDVTLIESADMYGFGCLVLWMLFPNLFFTSTSDGVPNINAFRSIIEEMLLPKDYAFLSTLVDAKPDRRPLSCKLLQESFLSKYEKYCRSKCEAQKCE